MLDDFKSPKLEPKGGIKLHRPAGCVSVTCLQKELESPGTGCVVLNVFPLNFI